MERELHGAVKLKLQMGAIRFTRRIRLQTPAPMLSTLRHREIITLPVAKKRRSIWEMRVNKPIRSVEVDVSGDEAAGAQVSMSRPGVSDGAACGRGGFALRRPGPNR